MTLDDLIMRLEVIREVSGGDTECFTNSEHGAETSVPLTDSYLTAAEPYIAVSMDVASQLPKDKIVVNIGGH